MIKKLIIPAAGYGTRFLPATKAIPKELLPVLDKPVVQYIVEEAIASGIKQVIFVITPDKQALKNHFKYNAKLSAHLRKYKKFDRLEKIKKLPIKISFINQTKFYGTAYPVLECEKLIGNQAFAVVWADEIDSGKIPRLKQLINAYNKYKNPVIAVYKTDAEGTKKYGIIKGKKISQDIYQVQELLEKPGPEKAPSRLGSRGGYILTPDIFNILNKLKKQIKKNQEFYLTDGIHEIAKKRPVYAKLIKNKLYDTGNVEDWLKANIELSKHHEKA